MPKTDRYKLTPCIYTWPDNDQYFPLSTTLKIISNEVPIEHDDILGTKLFRNNNAKNLVEISDKIDPFGIQETTLVPS